MKNHQIEYIFPIPFPHRFFAQIQNSQNKHGAKFFFVFFPIFYTLFLGFFSLRAKRMKERKKEEDEKKVWQNCLQILRYLSFFLVWIVCVVLFILFLFFFCVFSSHSWSAKYKNRFYYVSSMNTFHVDINRKQMSIDGSSGWRRMVREIEACDI